MNNGALSGSLRTWIGTGALLIAGTLSCYAKPEVPLKLDIRFKAEPVLNQPAAVVASVAPLVPAQDVRLEFTAPTNVTGTVELKAWTGSLNANEKKELETTIRFDKPGRYQVDVLAQATTSEGLRFGRRESLYIEVDASSVAFSKLSFADLQRQKLRGSLLEKYGGKVPDTQELTAEERKSLQDSSKVPSVESNVQE